MTDIRPFDPALERRSDLQGASGIGDIEGIGVSGLSDDPHGPCGRTPELERAHLAIRHPPAGRQRVRKSGS